ncbi:hypothetical protein [Halobacillus sp. Cin3]|uniref:hypothetical protein n=1 Tax=Halobacillus sp. Cin3 TaxID=2928441 RepID=UPI00248E5AD8|nr:hypothetical protein [Halobacillus sp. Cin3]
MGYKVIFIQQIKNLSSAETDILKNKRAAKMHAKDFLESYFNNLRKNLEDEISASDWFSFEIEIKYYKIKLGDDYILSIPRFMHEKISVPDEINVAIRIRGREDNDTLKIIGNEFVSEKYGVSLDEELMDIYLQQTFSGFFEK